MNKYVVKNFGTGEVFMTDNVKLAYRIADSMYRATSTMVKLASAVTGKILFDKCDNDFAVDEFIKYLNGKPSIYDLI